MAAIEGHDDTLTTGEAASLCGVSRSTLRRAVAHGQLRAWHTPGKHLRFTREACEAFARALGRGGGDAADDDSDSEADDERRELRGSPAAQVARTAG